MRRTPHICLFALCQIIAITLNAGAASFLKEPYLVYPLDSMAMGVMWQTDGTPVQSSIEWWRDPEDISNSGPLAESGSGLYEHQFSYTINELLPETHYTYRVTVDSETVTSSFSTAPSAGSNVATIYGYGDSRDLPNNHDRVVEQLLADVARAPERRQSIALHTGDLVNDGNIEADWDAYLFSRSYTNVLSFLSRMPLMPCWGNHEGTGELLQKYFPYSIRDNGIYYYSFDYGPAHVSVVDQGIDFSPGSLQHNWLSNDLASTQQPWRFVLMHAPAYSSGGRHDNDEFVYIQTWLSPLFEQHAVAIAISGHNHYYARCIVNDVQYITSGGGGVTLSDPEPDYHPSVVAAEKAYHFTRFEMFHKQMIATVIRDDGNIIERFALRSSDGSVTNFLKGDADGNGMVGLRDAILILHGLNIADENIIYTAADANGDNRIGIAEVIYAMQILAGIK